MGVKAPERDDDEYVVVLRAQARRLQVASSSATASWSARRCSATSARSRSSPRRFDRGLPLPEERVELLFDLGGPPRRGRRRRAGRRRPGLQLQRRHARATLVACVRGGVHSGHRRAWTRPAPARAAAPARRWSRRSSSGRAGGAVDEDPSADWYVPGDPDGQADADGGDPRAATCARCRRCSPRWRPAAARTRSRRWALASLLRDDVGRRVRRRARRPVHQRPRARQHPARRHVLGGAADARAASPTPDQLRRIADVADKYDVPMVKLTGGQRIDLLGVRKEDLPAVWADLDMPSGYAYGKCFRTVKTCVGTDFCRFGLGDSTDARHRRSRSATRASRARRKMKLAVTGLPAQLRRGASQGRRRGRGRAAAGGRSTSAARPARTSARATCSPPSTRPTR